MGLGQHEGPPSSITTPKAVRIQNTSRHPMSPDTLPPMSGAMIGAAPLMIIIKLKIRAAAAPSARSATIARLSTTPAAPPKP
jgi:hypothetical protein